MTPKFFYRRAVVIASMSLFVAASLTIIWIRSYSYGHLVHVRISNHYELRLKSEMGRGAVGLARVSEPAQHKISHMWTMADNGSLFAVITDTPGYRLGFTWHRQTLTVPASGFYEVDTSLVVGYWFALALLLTYPALWLILRW